MVDILLIGALVIGTIASVFFIGKYEANSALVKENDTLKRLQRNLNAEILDQRHQIQGVNGLWATDQPNLIKHHAQRERFFRIGYPEERL